MKKDIVIVGSGPAGLSFASSLANTSLNITIIDKLTEDVLMDPPIDGRDIALTHFSKKILETLGVWEKLSEEALSEIKEAKVLDGRSPYTLNFEASHNENEPLGYLVSNHLIRKVLFDKVKLQSNVKLRLGASVQSLDDLGVNMRVGLSNGELINASLVVAADSRFSQMRNLMGMSASMKDFGRTVIVCQMEHKEPHNGIAYECFHYGQTLAILPLYGNKSSIVITIQTSLAKELMNQDEDSFNKDIESRFKSKLGKMKLIGGKYKYPLMGVYANKFVSNRFALIGDAAVGMHPVTAHGYNLGLKGQETLSNLIKTAIVKGKDIGSQSILKEYQFKHHLECKLMYFGTNAMVNLFTNESNLSKFARKVILRVVNNFIPFKRIIVNKLTDTA